MEQRKRVLVVDDEASNRELLEALLTNLGNDVDLAADGAEALAKLDASHDLVLLDVMMAGIDGFEVARRIRSESAVPDIPICMVTALTGKEERLRAVEAGANDFITKPIDKTELRVRTASLLKMKGAQDAVKCYQAELEAQNERLREKYEECHRLGVQKDEFVRIASHDLKNPLMCIMGFVAVIELAIQPGVVMTEEKHQMLLRIAHNTRIMKKIISDFLDFQAMEDGQVKFKQEAVDLNALAGLALEQNAGHALEKGMTLESDLDANLPAIQADASRIGQVMDNLLSNAIKFSNKNERVNVCTRLADGFVFFEVRDWGPGLKEEDLQLLFVKYAKLSNKPTGDEESSGLGLAICKKMIKMQGGEIGGRNNPDGGTTFWFKFPAHGLAEAQTNPGAIGQAVSDPPAIS